jgi:aspartyl-tRNA(Asn)/glutamyl-tRNA(Gln) amidotransferase subunit C
MKIDVKKTAKLASLTLSKDEEKEFDEQLNDIIGYIEKLNSVDTTNIKPTAQVTGLVNVTRNSNYSDDTLSQEEALSGGKKIHNGLFVVEKLVDTTS